MPSGLVDGQTIRVIAESVGIAELPEDVAATLAPEVEYRLRDIVQEALKFMRHGRREVLSTEDINYALRLRSCEPLYGYTAAEAPRFLRAIGTSDVYYLEDPELNLADMIAEPLPAVPAEAQVSTHWLAVDGVQPNIPGNPTAAQVDAQRNAPIVAYDDRQAMTVSDNKLSRDEDGNNEDGNEEVDGFAREPLSLEEQQWLERVLEAVRAAGRESDAGADAPDSMPPPALQRVGAALLGWGGVRCGEVEAVLSHSLRSVAQLTHTHALGPFLAQFVANEVLTLTPPLPPTPVLLSLLTFTSPNPQGDGLAPVATDARRDDPADGCDAAVSSDQVSHPSFLLFATPHFPHFVRCLTPHSSYLPHFIFPIFRTPFSDPIFCTPFFSSSVESYLHQLIPAVVTCVVGKKLCANPATENHWRLRHLAAYVLREIMGRYADKFADMQPRLTFTLSETLKDPNKPLPTHYGALVGLDLFGPLVAHSVLMPLMPAYLKQLQQILRPAAPPEMDPAQKESTKKEGGLKKEGKKDVSSKKEAAENEASLTHTHFPRMPLPILPLHRTCLLNLTSRPLQKRMPHEPPRDSDRWRRCGSMARRCTSALCTFSDTRHFLAPPRPLSNAPQPQRGSRAGSTPPPLYPPLFAPPSTLPPSIPHPLYPPTL